MADEKPVHEQVQDLLSRWNKPPEDDSLSSLVGDQADRRDSAMDHDRNPGLSGVDAERMFADDGDDDDESGEALAYDDMTKAELQEEIERRNAERDEDDHLSKSGNKAELVARLEEDDESDEDDSDDE